MHILQIQSNTVVDFFSRHSSPLKPRDSIISVQSTWAADGGPATDSAPVSLPRLLRSRGVLTSLVGCLCEINT